MTFGLIISQDCGVRTTLIVLLLWPLWLIPLILLFVSAFIRGLITDEGFDISFDKTLDYFENILNNSTLFTEFLKRLK